MGLDIALHATCTDAVKRAWNGTVVSIRHDENQIISIKMLLAMLIFQNKKDALNYDITDMAHGFANKILYLTKIFTVEPNLPHSLFHRQHSVSKGKAIG